MKGIGFVIDMPKNSLMISNSCEVAQPDKNLRANRCSWNWKTDLLTAAGQVNLKESGNDQVRRADRMQGEFNPDGSIRLTPSGSRVKTQIKLQSEKIKNVNQKRPSQVQF